MSIRLTSLVCLLALLLAGCGASLTPLAESPELPPLDPQEIPTQGDATLMSPQIPTPADPYLQSLIEKAKEDLAQRLSISVTQIDLVEAASVTWPDGGLGCPQPGMLYTQVQVDGMLIRLSVEGRIYEYHSGGNRAPFLCK